MPVETKLLSSPSAPVVRSKPDSKHRWWISANHGGREEFHFCFSTRRGAIRKAIPFLEDGMLVLLTDTYARRYWELKPEMLHLITKHKI